MLRHTEISDHVADLAGTVMQHHVGVSCCTRNSPQFGVVAEWLPFHLESAVGIAKDTPLASLHNGDPVDQAHDLQCEVAG